MSRFAELLEAQAAASARQQAEERKVADFCNGVAAMFEKYLGGGSGTVAFTAHEVTETEGRHVEVTRPPFRREGSHVKTTLLFSVGRTTVVVPFTLDYDSQANVLRATAGKDGRKQFDMGSDGRPIADWLFAETKAHFQGANFLPAIVIL
jgi:hypothetical protein